MTDSERNERDLRALRYILDKQPFIAVSKEGIFLQIAYRVPIGEKRSWRLFRSAAWLFTKTAWDRLS